jgi:PAS domain S-box-containing protein
MNAACEQVCGTTLQQAAGKALWELFVPAEHAAKARADFAKLLTDRQPFKWEDFVRRGDGVPRLVVWTSGALLDVDGNVDYVICAGTDLTEERRIQDAARERQAELAQLHRMHTAGELAAALAHELSQPLTAIVGYAEASLYKLQQGSGALPEGIAALKKICEQAQSASRAIRELRALVSMGEQHRVPTDLNALVDITHRLMEAEARQRRIRIRLELAERLPAVLAEGIHIEHLLANLIRNGIEAIQESGKELREIVIRTHVDPAGLLKVTVRDTGPGVAAEAIEKIFEPFYTTKKRGLGIGLVISRSIAEGHGGQLWVEPSREGGIFHLTLQAA